MFALLPLLLLLTLFLAVARVAAVALEATGMARDSALFQSRSALMGVGYTTSEAEDITSHPLRRRIVLNLMTFGNAGIVTGIGSFLLTFIDVEANQTLRRSALLVLAVTIIFLLFHTRYANRLIRKGTESALRKFTNLDTKDYAALLRLDDRYAITELHTRDGEWLIGTPLSKLHLEGEGVVILGVNRSDGTFLATPTGDTVLQDGDDVIAYGRVDVLRELATRPARTGDRIHDKVVADQEEILTHK